MAITIKAYSNCDDTFVVWRPDQRIDGCLGFALLREKSGMVEPVPTWMGFEGDSAQPGEHRPSTQWPIQKFLWADYFAQAGDTLRYRVVPMVGTRGNLQQAQGQASDWSEQIQVGAANGEGASAYFNRGIVAAQWLVRRLGNVPPREQKVKLGEIIKDVTSEIRKFLAGPVRSEMLDLLGEVKNSGGKIYAALYELNDPELIQGLESLGEKANVILANGSAKSHTDDENAEARRELQGKVTLFNRMVGSGHLAHNKFLVICDQNDQPKKAWTGSTNWSVTGLCTQANNGILFDNPLIASWFKNQWEQLKQAGDDFPKWLTDADSKEKSTSVDSEKIAAWFTPVRNGKDLAYARDLINQAKQGILFLMFNPGPAGTLLNDILARRDSGLYIHGVVNQDPGGKRKPVITMYHRGDAVAADPDVVLPEAIDEHLKYWQPELKNYSIAMVHSKVILLDPFGSHPVVMTGSHNLGPKASSKNDDNLVIVEGAPKLAAAYAVNIISIYNQYRWRYTRMTSEMSKKWMGLNDKDTWQDGYYRGAKLQEIKFWLGQV